MNRCKAMPRGLVFALGAPVNAHMAPETGLVTGKGEVALEQAFTEE